jgi:hypothetical protein
MTHHIEARYDQQEHMFLPPQRTLGFNPQLKLNDSLLVQSYVEAYDISYPEALRRIEDEVEELKQHLDNEGYYELNDIGRLTVNDEGNLEFEPCEAGILTPDLYGLSSFEMNQIADITAKVNEQEMAHEASGNSNHHDQAITIKMSWVRNAVAIAAAVVAFFFIATPVANSDLGTQTMSQLQNSILYKLIPQDTTLPAVEPVIAEPAVAKTAVAVDKQDAQEASTPASTTYCIIVASQVKQSNAELYVEKLKKEGHPNAYVYVSNNVVRVVSDEFNSEADAYRLLNKMNMHEEFYEAWVYKKVNG